MFSNMVVDIGERHCLLEQALLQGEVVVVLDVRLLDVRLGVLPLNLEDGVEESTVFVVDLRVLHREGLVPAVRVGHGEDHLGGGHPGQAENQQVPHCGGSLADLWSSCDALITRLLKILKDGRAFIVIR